MERGDAAGVSVGALKRRAAMADDSQKKRNLLRRALDFLTGKSSEATGFSLGPTTTVNLHDLLAATEDDGKRMLLINVSIDLKEADRDRVDDIDDAISMALEEKGVGEWAGAGTFSDGKGCAIRDIDYAVTDEGTAFAVIRDTLMRENAPPSTCIVWKGREVFPMRDEAK